MLVHLETPWRYSPGRLGLHQSVAEPTADGRPIAVNQFLDFGNVAVAVNSLTGDMQLASGVNPCRMAVTFDISDKCGLRHILYSVG